MNGTNGTSSQGRQPFNESSGTGRDSDGLICAFEFTGCWVPISQTRILELVSMEDEDELPVTGVEGSKRPIWWCHLFAGHPFAMELLSNPHLLYPDTSIALREQSMLISERMQHFQYQVPVCWNGGLFFQLLARSFTDPSCFEDSTSVVIKFWQRKNILVTVLHADDSSLSIVVPGIIEVMLILLAGRSILISAQDVMAQLICHISRCDDRLFRKSILYVADEIQLKFLNRTINQEQHLHSVKANKEIIELTNKAIRIKWLLHAREEIVFGLLQYLHESTTKSLLDGVIKFTREMLEELEVVHEHLFALLRIWLEEEKVKITHNVGILGGCGMILSVITSLFGINVDGIPGSQNSPYAFTIFCGVVIVFGIFLIWFSIFKFGYKKYITL